MDYGLMVQLGGISVAVVGAVYVAKWRVDQAEKRLDGLEDKFQKHEIMVAREYVSAHAFAKFEHEIKGGIDRLTDRLDKVLATRGSR